MKVALLFYQDSNPIDCDVFGVYTCKLRAIRELEERGWHFAPDTCTWYNNEYRGTIEILERTLH